MKQRLAHMALGSEPAMTASALSALDSGGTSVDACIAGLFAAAGLMPGVLLGSMVLLVSGTGVGTYVFDGSVVQPGLGVPRPRGFVHRSDIPPGACVPVSASGAMLAAAHAHDGHLSMQTLAGYGVRTANGVQARARANLLGLFGQLGALALCETPFVRAMLAVAGRPEGGNTTTEDIVEVRASVGKPVVTGGVVHVGARPLKVDLPQLECLVVVACDRRGVFAVAHCAFDPRGPEIVPYGVVASRLAFPVRRGVPRIQPGTSLQLPVPIALLTNNGVPWAAVAIEAIANVDWERVDSHVLLDVTLEQAIEPALTVDNRKLKALAVVAGLGGELARSCVIRASAT